MARRSRRTGSRAARRTRGPVSGRRAGARAPTAAAPGETRIPESLEGTVVYRVPFPADLADLKTMSPIVVRQPYHIDYVHSFGQDSPFFAGLANRRLLGTRCRQCGYTYATPRLACMGCGGETDWVELPRRGRIHTFTTCYFGSEEFLPECPFHLILVEFEGVDTLFMARLVGPSADAIRVGMEVEARFRRHARFKPTDVYFVPAAPAAPTRRAAARP